MLEEHKINFDEVDAERKHLESLLKDRINFHLLFASVFVAGLSNIADGTVKLVALTTITVISLLLALAVLRTHRLVGLALKEITNNDEHPYTRYQKQVRFPPNANNLLLAVPFILTACFFAASVHYLSQICSL